MKYTSRTHLSKHIFRIFREIAFTVRRGHLTSSEIFVATQNRTE